MRSLPWSTAALLLVACGTPPADRAGGALAEAAPAAPAAPEGYGVLRTHLVDAPSDLVTALRVTLLAVEARDCATEAWSTVWSDASGVERDLLQLRGGFYAALGGDVVFPVGEYCELRLVLDETASAEFADGTSSDLKVPSGSSSGLKIKGAFAIEEGLVTVVTLDFDVAESLHVTGGGDRVQLDPVIHVQSVEYFDDPDDADGALAAEGTTTVGADGATVAVDGVEIVFPAGAVASETTFAYEVWEPDVDGFASRILRVSPPTTFPVGARPIVTLAYTDAASVDDSVHLLVDGEPVVTTLGPDGASGEVPHFSDIYLQPLSELTLDLGDSTVRCYGPEAYWTTDADAATEGWNGEMDWTWNNDAGDGVENYCQWTFDAHQGTYRVEAWIPANHATAEACYRVTTGAGDTEISLDQAAYFGEWVALGTFEANGALQVTLTDLTTEADTTTWVGFDAIRVVPAVGETTGPALPACGSTPGVVAGPALSERHIEFWDDVEIGFGAPSDVIYLDEVAADELRGAGWATHWLAAYAILSFADVATAFIASEGDLYETLNATVDPYEEAVGEALDGWAGATLDLLPSLVTGLAAYAVADVIDRSSGAVYIVIQQYPRYEIDVGRYYPNGRVVIADGLAPDQLLGIDDGSAWTSVYLSFLDEEALHPDSCTLGKQNCDGFFSPECYGVPNDWTWHWLDWEWYCPLLWDCASVEVCEGG